MEDPGTGPGSGRRGRHAAPPAGPVGPLSRVVAGAGAATVAVAAAASRAVAGFRAGPVLPWIAAHRIIVLVAGALVVSGAAFAATAAVISQPPLADGSGSVDGDSRPRPGSGFVMPSPVAGTPGATTVVPTTTPTPDPTQPADEPAAVEAPVIDPEPTTDPVEPTEEPKANGRPDPPGATNRPDKTKD